MTVIEAHERPIMAVDRRQDLAPQIAAILESLLPDDGFVVTFHGPPRKETAVSVATPDRLLQMNLQLTEARNDSPSSLRAVIRGFENPCTVRVCYMLSKDGHRIDEIALECPGMENSRNEPGLRLSASSSHWPFLGISSDEVANELQRVRELGLAHLHEHNRRTAST